MPRRRILYVSSLVLALSSAAVPTAAQLPFTGPRIAISAWAGGYVNKNSGFSAGTNDFYSFDRSIAFGGGVHASIRRGLFVGVDASWSGPGYTHFERNPPQELNTGDATMYSAILSARLQGTPGRFGLYLTGGAGFFFFDVPELGERNKDNALLAGVGVEYQLKRALSLFAEYDQWWIYHDKVDEVLKNRVSRNLLRFGTRFGLL